VVRALVSALLLVVACRDAYDISQPIDIVATGTWTDSQLVDLVHAAECWNLGFGVDLSTTRTGDRQRETVEFDELMCLNTDAWAWTASSLESKTMICPFDIPPNVGEGKLFGLLAHELGHVVGIPQDTDDASSIMGGYAPINLSRRESGDLFFSSTDHALFDSDNSDFVQHATCDPKLVIASSYECSCP
jgi:hypothetical protein